MSMTNEQEIHREDYAGGMPVSKVSRAMSIRVRKKDFSGGMLVTEGFSSSVPLGFAKKTTQSFGAFLFLDFKITKSFGTQRITHAIEDSSK